MDKPLVGIVMGSDSDLPVMAGAAKTLDEFGLPYEINILSAHRTPEETAAYARSAEERGLAVIIAAAGQAAHLAGSIAAATLLPVIGVPISSGALSGVDALYSTVQMPPGIPVATVGVNGAVNAAVLAAQIIGAAHPETRQKIKEYKQGLAAKVREKNALLGQLGVEGYLEQKKSSGGKGH